MFADSQFTLKGQTPDTAIPQFFLEPVLMNFKSEQEGRPVYEDREFVRIITPGVAKCIPCEEVTDEHKRRWPNQYKAWKDGQDEPITGLPLSRWPLITPAVVNNLAGLNIRTVEELASVNDSVLDDLGTGGRDLRDKAQKYLAMADDGKPLAEALARAQRAEDQLAVIKQQYDDLASRLGQVEKRGPGRPRKEPSFQEALAEAEE